MATISEIKETIIHLPENEFNSFANWFQKLEQERWDKELEKDIAAKYLTNIIGFS